MKITLKTSAGTQYFLDDETLRWSRWHKVPGGDINGPRYTWQMEDEGELAVMPDIRIGERVILVPRNGPVRTTDEIVWAAFTKGERHIV